MLTTFIGSGYYKAFKLLSDRSMRYYQMFKSKQEVMNEITALFAQIAEVREQRAYLKSTHEDDVTEWYNKAPSPNDENYWKGYPPEPELPEYTMLYDMTAERAAMYGHVWLEWKEPHINLEEDIDCHSFDISNGSYCILGQTHGDYGAGLEELKLGNEEAVVLGFDTHEDVPYRYTELDKAWRDELGCAYVEDDTDDDEDDDDYDHDDEWDHSDHDYDYGDDELDGDDDLVEIVKEEDKDDYR